MFAIFAKFITFITFNTFSTFAIFATFELSRVGSGCRRKRHHRLSAVPLLGSPSP
jgi:hypothetical protein